VTKIVLSPLANSGFTATRANFCTKLNATTVNDTFCPDTDVTNAEDPVIHGGPAGRVPKSTLLGVDLRARACTFRTSARNPNRRSNSTVNVQGLVHVVDTAALPKFPPRTSNLNAQIRNETEPANRLRA
jgi:hypothetical protein